MALHDKIGNFEVGKEFDAIIVDMNVQIACAPLEILQKFVYLGDDRNVLNVYVAGKLVK